MMDFLRSIEQLSFSTWIREGGALYGYPLVLFLHTMGLAVVVGSVFTVDLRLLGVSPSMPLKPLLKLHRFMWYGFTLNLITGVILIMADATVKLTNYDFYVKLGLIAAGLLVQRAIHKKMMAEPSDAIPSGIRTLVWASLVCWMGAIVAGRLLAYLGPVAGLA